MRLRLLFATMALMSAPAYAYIGPGAGLGAIATFIAIILGVILLVVGFVWYPLKRMLNKRKSENDSSLKKSSEGANQ